VVGEYREAEQDRAGRQLDLDADLRRDDRLAGRLLPDVAFTFTTLP
jgi:hypothetical protein